MSGEAWLFLFAVLINAVNLFLQVFFTIMYSDLEWYARNTSPTSITIREPPRYLVCVQEADTMSTTATTSTLLTSATA